jgi:hypothetical protein
MIGVGSVPELAEQFGEESTRIEVGFEDAGADARASIAKQLGEIPGVDEVIAPTQPGEPFVLVTKPDAAKAVRQAALRNAASANLGLSSIRETVPSLDDIYRRAVRQAGLHTRRAA